MAFCNFAYYSYFYVVDSRSSSCCRSSSSFAPRPTTIFSGTGVLPVQGQNSSEISTAKRRFTESLGVPFNH